MGNFEIQIVRRPQTDKMGNFEIQDLYAGFNQSETLASSYNQSEQLSSSLLDKSSTK